MYKNVFRMKKFFCQLPVLGTLFLLLPLLSTAQVQVSVTVTPPYSGYLKDYVKDGSNVLISITNVSGQPQTLKLLSTLTGDNGVKLVVKDSYMPLAPVVLAPNETKLITQNGLRAFNANLSEGDVQHQGISQAQVLQGGKLPEGVYQLCVRAMSFSPNPAALGNAGCGSFSVLFYDPPILMNPAKEAVINSQQPQLIPFSWSPSGVGGKTKYSLRLVDLTTTGVFNANDAFLNDAIFPFFKQDGIATNAYIYDMGKPKLTENHKYAVQIVASDPQGKLQYKNGGRSEVSTFTYKNTGLQIAPSPNNGNTQGALPQNNMGLANNNNGQSDPPAGPCSGSTKYGGQIDGAQKNNIPNGTDIAVGMFVMKNTKFSKSNGSYDGTGEILVAFLNTRVLVEFKGITINASNRMAAGTITGKVTSYSVIDQGMSSVKTGMLEKVPDMDGLMGYLEKGTRQVNKLNPAKVPLDLPLNFKKDDFNMGIVGLIFEPKEAFVNAVLNTPVPQIYGDDYLLLSAKGIAIQPNGYGSPEIKLALAKDQSVKLSNGVSLTFKGGADKTFATFDCGGFKAISMDGAYTFSRSLLLPVDNSGNVINGAQQVQIGFKVAAATSLQDLLYTGLAFSSPFAIPQAPDFVFSAAGITLDLSQSKNGADFKTAYPNKGADWTGIFLQNVSVRLPAYLKKGGGESITLALSKATADKAGFQGNFSVAGDLLKGGSLAGLGLDVKSLSLNIENSSIKGGGMGGSIKLPLGDNATVDFSANISAGNAEGANIGFIVSPASDIDANLFFANLKIIKGSTIGIAKKDGVFTASALLNGELGVDFSNKTVTNTNISKVNIPSLKFQELSIVSKEGGGAPDFDIAFVQLQNIKTQATIGGAFEVNLTSLDFTKRNGNVKGVDLSFGLGLTILGGEAKQSNGFGAKTGLTIRAIYNAQKRSFVYDRTRLDSIAIEAELGVATVAGTINIYDEDATYGNGFRGALSATVKGIDIAVAIVAQFGRTLPAKGNFKYWFFDAMVDMGNTGIPIPGTVASFYGFGGGAWCNMSASGGADKILPGSYTAKNGGGSGAPTRSGVKFVPMANSGGFKAAVLFGLSGSRDAFNGDLTFTMGFDTKNLSVNALSLVGNAYLMQNPNDLSKRNSGAFVHAGAKININIPKRIFSGNFNADIKVGEIIKGGGELAIEFDRPDQGKQGPTKWFVKVGSWTPGVDPFEDDARLHASIGFDAKVIDVKVKFEAYFMVGNNLAFGLPPLPNEIYALLKDDGVQQKKPLPNVVADEVNLAFAFGAGLKLTAGFDFFILSADLLAMAGFDAVLANAHVTCNGKEAGFNGWYAKGQAYAMLQGDMKLFRKIPVASFVAGAVLQFMGPNPNYIAGDIVAYIDVFGHKAGEYHGHFQRGEVCEGMKTEFNPFANLKLIKSTSPEKVGGGVKGVDPFTKLTVKFAYHAPAIYRSYLYMYDAYNNKQVTYEFVPTIKLLDSKGYEVPIRTEPVIYQEELVNIFPKQTLNEKSNYKLVVDAYVTGPNNKQEKHEQVVAEFTTAAYPEYIHLNDLTDAYPVPMQRYVMSTRIIEGGQQSLVGQFTFNRNLDYFTKKYKATHNIVVRFTDVATGDQAALASPTEFANRLAFPMPQNLKGSTIYHVGVYMTPKTDLLKGNINNLALSNDGERIIFPGYYFRTSKYKSFSAKFATYKVKKVGYIPEMNEESMLHYSLGNADGTNKGYYTPVLLLQGDEPIDVAEYSGYIKNGEKDVLHCSSSAEWIGTMSGTYVDAYHPQISASDRTLLVNITNVGQPFYKKVDYWLKHTDWRESDLRNGGYLKGNESLAKPEGPLTTAEIDAVRKKATGPGEVSMDNLPLALAPPPKPGNGLYNSNMPLNSTHQYYYALADKAYNVAVDAKVEVTGKRLYATRNDVAKQLKVWNLHKKMGYPTYPKGNHTIQMEENAGTYDKTNEGWIFRKIDYNYGPPAFKQPEAE